MSQWQVRAQSVCKALLDADPLHVTLPDQVNLLISALIGLTHPTTRPASFAQHAVVLDCDGIWGPVAQAAHMKLAEECGDNDLRLAVARYYAQQ